MNEDAVCEKGDRLYGRFRNLQEGPIIIMQLDIVVSGEDEDLDNTSLLFEAKSYVHGNANSMIYTIITRLFRKYHPRRQLKYHRFSDSKFTMLTIRFQPTLV